MLTMNNSDDKHIQNYEHAHHDVGEVVGGVMAIAVIMLTIYKILRFTKILVANNIRTLYSRTRWSLDDLPIIKVSLQVVLLLSGSIVFSCFIFFNCFIFCFILNEH